MTLYHNPVLLTESIEELVTLKNGIYVDVTFGGGGHSEKLLKKSTMMGDYLPLTKILIVQKTQ